MKLKMTGTFEKIVGTPDYLDKLRKSHLKNRKIFSLEDNHRDIRKNQRGYLAPNIVSQIKNDAKKRDYNFALSDQEIYNFIVSDCKYCGVSSGWPEKRNGIDRVDSSLGYFSSNCVTACFTCNAAK